MKKLLYLVALGGLLCIGAHAQVTIGSREKPAAGALLDLKDETAKTSPAGGPTAMKGLGLPRVKLKAINSLEPCVKNATTAEKATHVGLLVYNIQSNGDEGLSKGLNIWDGAKWSAITPDSSMGLDGANSFIVTPGDKIDIAVRKAYTIWNTYNTQLGGATLSNNLTAELYWQDEAGLITNTSAAASWALPIVGTGNDAKIKIETGHTEGNALVVVKIDGTVRWSWHVWVTYYQPDQGSQVHSYNNGEADYVFMDRNLGSKPANYDIGMYYQWGRKDPFPMVKGYGDLVTLVPPTLTGAEPTISVMQGPSGSTSLEGSLLAPATYYTANSASGAWVTDPKIPLWDTDGKSIFDPCPAGWQVPAYSSKNTDGFGNLLKSGHPWYFPDFPASANMYDYGGESTTAPSYQINFYNNARYPLGSYPRAGHIEGYTSGIPNLAGQEVNIWTATINQAGPGSAQILSMFSIGPGYGNITLQQSHQISNGLQVRCVKEGTTTHNKGFKGVFKGRSEFGDLAGGIETIYFYTPNYQPDGAITFTISGNVDILNNATPAVTTPVTGITAVQGVDYQHGYKIDLDFKPTTGVDKTLVLTANMPDGTTVAREININHSRPVFGAKTTPAYTAKWGATWLDFAGYNLGADTTADPFVASKEVNGNYYQWGKKEPVASAPHEPGGDVAYPNFEDNLVTGVNNWNLGTEAIPIKNTEYDPCPTGWRIPAAEEWNSAGYNTDWVSNGSFSPTGGDNNWFTAGNISPTTGQPTLMMPAPGRWGAATLSRRGRSAYIYSSLKEGQNTGQVVIMNENEAMDTAGYTLNIRATVRCIKE